MKLKAKRVFKQLARESHAYQVFAVAPSAAESVSPPHLLPLLPPRLFSAAARPPPHFLIYASTHLCSECLVAALSMWTQETLRF